MALGAYQVADCDGTGTVHIDVHTDCVVSTIIDMIDRHAEIERPLFVGVDVDVALHLSTHDPRAGVTPRDILNLDTYSNATHRWSSGRPQYLAADHGVITHKANSVPGAG
jgi:hypothetical protein